MSRLRSHRFIHLVWKSAEHLCGDVISELVEGQGLSPLEVSEALLGAFHVQDVAEVCGEHLKQTLGVTNFHSFCLPLISIYWHRSFLFPRQDNQRHAKCYFLLVASLCSSFISSLETNRAGLITSSLWDV